MTVRLQLGVLGTALVSLALAAPAFAQGQVTAARPATSTAKTPPKVILAAPPATAPADADATASVPMVQPVPLPEPQLHWTLANARALLAAIEGIGADGLIPADYQLVEMRAAIADGEGLALDTVASQSFSWLAEDLRDGRTPMTARLQWFAVDPDQDKMPTSVLMKQALDTNNIPAVLASLAPTHPDYKVLKAALAATPEANKARRAQIQANMDRWRWLARDMGGAYLITNVPEFQLRLTVNDKIIRTYRTVVGKPGRTATPQLAETVQAVVFNPTWTVPQSIVVGEGLGASLMRSPRAGYKATRNADGTITVVQQPGDSNSLGRMKIDMPNPHAIYLHDTPSKQYFSQPVRAYSHGCIRTERAVELGMTMAILGAGLSPEQSVQYSTSGKYTRVPMTRTFPVYITYFTTGVDITGKLSTFTDIYGRDAPVLASFNQPRQLKTTQRTSNEEIIKLDNPL
jgi:murein L,D-transpeptidase YcbB/YkuD